MATFVVTLPGEGRFKVGGVETEEEAYQAALGQVKQAQLGETTGNSVLIGVGRGMTNVGQAIKQTALDVARGLGERGIEDPQAYRQARQEESDLYQGTPVGQSAAGKTGEVLGEVAATAPIYALGTGGAIGGLRAALPQAAKWLAPTVGGALAGGAIGATLSPEDRATGATFGALLAGGAEGIGQALRKGVTGAVTPSANARALMAEGVQPTVGQAVQRGPGHPVGTAIARAEEAVSSIPVVGSFVRGARARAVGELNDAALRRASPPGYTLPKGTRGHEAIRELEQAYDNAYKAVYGNRVLPLPRAPDAQRIVTAVSDPKVMASPEVRREVLDEIAKITDLGVTQGGYRAEAIKTAESEIKRRVREFTASADPLNRERGRLYDKALKAFQVWRNRALGPDDAAKAAQLDRNYRNFITVQRASSAVATDAGEFSAAQLNNAVRAGAGGVRKGQYARGTANMQDLSDAGRALGATVADSGTPERAAAMALMGGGGYYLDPALGVALGAGVPLLSTRTAQRFLTGGLPWQAKAAPWLEALQPWATGLLSAQGTSGELAGPRAGLLRTQPR